MSIGKTRGFLYWLNRLLGNANASRKARMRVARCPVQMKLWRAMITAMRAIVHEDACQREVQKIH